MGMPPTGNRNSAVTAVGAVAVKILPPRPIPKLVARRFCMLDLERSSLRGLTRTFGVSRATVSSWIKKKELSFLLSIPPYWPPIPKMPVPRCWNWTSCGRLYSKKCMPPGCGLPCVARRDRWSPMSWVIEVKRHASGCGRTFHQSIARGIVSPTSGQHMQR